MTAFRFQPGEVDALADVNPITEWAVNIRDGVVRFCTDVDRTDITLARKPAGYDVEIERAEVSTICLVPDLSLFARIVSETIEAHARIVAAATGVKS